jgi:hypothetical protein
MMQHMLQGGPGIGILAIAFCKVCDKMAFQILLQVPFLDGKDSFKQNVKTRGYLRIFRAFAAGVHDTLRSLFHYPAAYFPLATKDGTTAFMQLDEEEWVAYKAKHPDVKQVRWDRSPASSFLDVVWLQQL